MEAFTKKIAIRIDCVIVSPETHHCLWGGSSFTSPVNFTSGAHLVKSLLLELMSTLQSFLAPLNKNNIQQAVLNGCFKSARIVGVLQSADRTSLLEVYPEV